MRKAEMPKMRFMVVSGPKTGCAGPPVGVGFADIEVEVEVGSMAWEGTVIARGCEYILQR